MMDKTCSTDYSADISGDAHTVFLSRPAFGKHVVFDGRFLPCPLNPSQKQRQRSGNSSAASAAGVLFGQHMAQLASRGLICIAPAGHNHTHQAGHVTGAASTA